ncbi:MAG: sugar transferase [Clostridia bacterium]|nr:sugar transferase [Clostridia bacterium]
MYKKYFKRLFDIVFSLIAIIILMPVYLIISILVLISLGRPILFKQPRPGKNEKIFNIYKFRTMSNEKDENGNLLSDTQRITKIGYFLRKSSLDELPEMFCILSGKMSFVGPRPLIVKYLPYYTEEEHHRHDIRPGLTGWAQINGRNNINWDDRLALDLEYVNNMSLLFDIKILLLTIGKVLKASDISLRGTNNTIDFDEYRRKQNGTIEGNRQRVLDN